MIPIFAHGSYGYWDELLGILAALLFAAFFAAVWLYSRRFQPELENGSDDDEPAQTSKKHPLD